MLVILDTNFIIACMKTRVDPRFQIEKKDPHVEFLVLGRVMEEIGALAVRERKLAEAFLLGTPHRVVPSSGPTDRDLLEYAVAARAAVATLDSRLKKSLKRHGVQIISLSRSKIVFS